MSALCSIILTSLNSIRPSSGGSTGCGYVVPIMMSPVMAITNVSCIWLSMLSSSYIPVLSISTTGVGSFLSAPVVEQATVDQPISKEIIKICGFMLHNTACANISARVISFVGVADLYAFCACMYEVEASVDWVYVDNNSYMSY